MTDPTTTDVILSYIDEMRALLDDLDDLVGGAAGEQSDAIDAIHYELFKAWQYLRTAHRLAQTLRPRPDDDTPHVGLPGGQP